jgi:RNA polymerase sigma-70 factor (ECF subfamily)
LCQFKFIPTRPDTGLASDRALNVMPFGQPSPEYTGDAENDWRDEGGVLVYKHGAEQLKQRVARHFEQWRDPVYRYLMAVFGPATQADEITQEVFLKLYEALCRGQEIANARAWVFRVAHNLAVDQFRGQQFIAPLDEDAWEEACRSLQDTQPSPEQRVLQVEKLSRLNAAVARLTLIERQCLHLRASGLRYREIAEIVTLSMTAVAETLYRVIQKLANETHGS